jgi:hypothetical protein
MVVDMESIRSVLEWIPAWLRDPATVVSLVSLVISLLAYRSSHRTSRRMVEIEENRDRAAHRQAAKAKLVASREKISTATYRLTVQNDGTGTAREISIALDGTPISGHGSIIDGNSGITTLSPGGSLNYTLIPTLDNPFPNTIRVEWRDDSGEPGLCESGL